MQPTLLILAAGMASRYGSMKQTEGFGPTGETIMDYSIYDAIKAGFGKVVFIIRKDFAEQFKATFEPKLKGKIATEYVYQEMDSFVEDATIAASRQKPWGTAHAILCAKEVVKESFAVINADDFYGKDGFVKAAQFLRSKCTPSTYSIIGYQLAKTLSEFGTVSRGVCEVDSDNKLVSIKERTKLYKEQNRIVFEDNDEKVEVPYHSSVSMNFWCFHPAIFTDIQKLFKQFAIEHVNNPKAEFFIPILAQNFMENNHGSIEVIPTNAQWFGVTYKEDAPIVKASIDKLIADKEYPANLWG